MIDVFDAFHSKNQWCKSLSAAFITLIPKIKVASEVKDFRPICLVGCLYKLLAKVLAIKLKNVFSFIILETQNDFLPGHQITDRIILANESNDTKRKVGMLGIVCKIDIKKAYDYKLGLSRLDSRAHEFWDKVKKLDEDLCILPLIFCASEWFPERIL